MDAAAGASRTTSPGWASAAARATTTSMTPVSVLGDVDDGDVGRVSGQGLGDPVPVGADEHDAAQPVGRRADQVVDVGALEQAAGDPDDRSNDSSDAAAACGLVALESSTKRTPSTVGDVGDAVRVGRNARRPSRTATGRDTVRPRQRRGSERVGDVVRRDRRSVALQVGQGRQLGGRGAPLLDERPVGQHVVDDADHRQAPGRPG